MRKLLLTALLCLLTASACADGLYFVNPDGGSRLHADPFCPSVSAKYLPLTPVPQGAGDYEPCSICWIQFALPEATEEPAQPASWYCNPDGGQYFHTDANCPSIAAKYLPLTATVQEGDELMAQLEPCHICGASLPAESCLYLQSLSEKAASQPGVWGMPEADHVHADIAYEEAMIALKKDYGIDEDDKHSWLIGTFFYPRGASGYDEAHYRVVVLEGGDRETLAGWKQICWATVGAETGKVRTFK